MDPASIYAYIVAVALVLSALLILAGALLGSRRRHDQLSNPVRQYAPAHVPTLAETRYDPDVGRCIIAGCTNWSEQTICNSIDAAHRCARGEDV